MNKNSHTNQTTRYINNMIKSYKDAEEIRTKDISDGYHTFGQLYHDRAVLFAIICNTYKENAYKSKLHHDGTMFDDMFIVGVYTPEGHFTYHYHMEYWNMYDVEELSKAPEWDGHTFEDIDRLFGLLGTK